MMEYKNIIEDNIDSLENIVSEHIAKGWVPQGQLSTVYSSNMSVYRYTSPSLYPNDTQHINFIQTMVKHNKTDRTF